MNAYSNIVRIGVEKSANREKNVVQKRDILLPKIKCEKDKTNVIWALSPSNSSKSALNLFIKEVSAK